MIYGILLRVFFLVSDLLGRVRFRSLSNQRERNLQKVSPPHPFFQHASPRPSKCHRDSAGG